MFERFHPLENAPLREYTTLRLGGPADWLVTPTSEEALRACVGEAREHGIPITVIGYGSNLLVLDGGIRGLVLRLARGLNRCEVKGNQLIAGAGVMMGAAANLAAEHGLTGLEFASGIPGTVGGGVIMNAGAYGGELSQTVRTVTVLRMDGTREEMSNEALAFGYRHSALQGTDGIVIRAVMELRPGKREEIRSAMMEMNRKRAEKQPLDLPSAGSTFKRPAGGFAAALIDQCGLKGFRIGGASVSEKHAGFLVNTGTSAADYLALVRTVQEKVEEQTGIRLEPEIRILGESG